MSTIPRNGRFGRLGQAVAQAFDQGHLRRARRGAETTRHADEAISHAMFNAVQAHLAVLDEYGTIVAVNDAWVQFAVDNGGLPDRTGLGVNYLDICRAAAAQGDEKAQAVLAGIESVLDHSRTVFSLEYPCHAPAEQRWFLLRVVSLRGDHRGAAVTHSSVTARRLAELAYAQAAAALRESEARYRGIVEQALEGIFQTDFNDHFVTINAAAARMLGYDSPEQVLAVQPSLRTLYADPARQDDFIALMQADERVTNFEFEARRRDGDRIWLALNARVLRDAAGQIAGIEGMASDIGARRAADEAERRRQWEFEALAEHAPDVISRFDRAHRYLYANPAIEATSGLARAAYLGKTTAELGLPTDATDRWGRYLSEVFAVGEEREIAFDWPTPEGRRSYLNRLVPEHGPDGEVVSVLSIARDVTEMKRAERQLTMRLRQQAAVASLGQLALSGMALTALMTVACERVAETLGFEYVSVMALQPGGQSLLVTAGVGWGTGSVGTTMIAAGTGSLGGYALSTGVPVIVEDLRTETRFAALALREHGIISGLGVVIAGQDDHFGVLGAFTTSVRRISQDDVHLLQSVANLLATALRRAAASDALRMQAQLLDAVGEAVIATDLDGVIQYWNRSAERLYGWTADEVRGRSIIDATPSTVAQGQSLGLMERLRSGESWTGEVEVRRRDGSTFPAEVTNAPVVDEQGQLTGIIGVSSDITTRKKIEGELINRAFHDTLTGLPNRALVLERLTHRLAGEGHERHSMALFFLDLDGFKVVNDSLGHAFGDRLLSSVAQRLQHAVRPGDTVGRFGGDEFVLLIDAVTSPESTLRFAERILEHVCRPIVLDGREFVLTTSIGITLITPAAVDQDAADLLRQADIALYQAKAMGKGRAVLFEPAMNERAVARLELETDLRRAMERDEFVVHYQPAVSLVTGAITGMEALVRWQHPTRGLVSPLDFIPLAEETGLIVPLGRWVLREACRQAAAWQQELALDPPLLLSVNLSARQLRDPRLVADMTAILRETGMPAELLWLELTETVLLTDSSKVQQTLQALRALGVQLALDDFGTGYSSLSYLRQFPVGMVKLDRSFVMGITTDPDAAAIVQAVTALAHALGMQVTAEGVEDEAQLARLRAMGVDWLQGYLVARPLQAAAFRTRLEMGRQVLPAGQSRLVALRAS